MSLSAEVLDRLEARSARYAELSGLLGQPDIASDLARLRALSKEQADLEELVMAYRGYQSGQKELTEARSLAEETTDDEMRQMAEEEIEQLQERVDTQEAILKRLLTPKDKRDAKDVIVEIRAGTGGEEAGLFAADLYRMYSRYAERRNWQTEVLSSNETGIGGFKEIIFEIHGKGVYSRLKYESGVHRVQRVPTTETSGRIHTSTATVAMLPVAEEVDIEINEGDLRVDIFHSGGAGGQNVNKVATAVRLTHIPTGTVVICQDERSQLKNRIKAMAVLRARLLAQEEEKHDQAVSQERRLQVGSADRSEKSRTYNFPQNRITDHRAELSFHNLPQLMDGDLDAMIDAVATEQEARLLEGRDG